MNTFQQLLESQENLITRVTKLELQVHNIKQRYNLLINTLRKSPSKELSELGWTLSITKNDNL